MQFPERVIACFQALATGDAIGKQTEMLSRAEVRHWYPGGITRFHGTPGEVIPRYTGKRYEWRIGETTDDTEQTLAVARALLCEGGRASHEAVGRELLRCRKSLHPAVSLWRFARIGDASHIASDGDGCGAAMRIAPVGVVYPSSRLDALARAAYECAIPTHGGQPAICAAAATAGAVSAALEGRSAAEALETALAASRQAEMLRPAAEPSRITASLQAIHSDLATRKGPAADDLAGRYVPDQPQNIVPLAIGLALATQSAQETALLAANFGGDSDSVASIGGAIAGALYPETVNQDWFEVVRRINGAELVDLATALAALRRGG